MANETDGLESTGAESWGFGVATTPAAIVAPLRAAANEEAQTAYVIVNATVTPLVEEPLSLPVLEEVTVEAWKAGVKSVLKAVRVGPHIIEKNTAYDYLLMVAAAEVDGVKLPLNAAWRSNAKQKQLYEERVNPDGTETELGKRLGVAAKPGHSNHQGGIALDINVQLNKDQYKAGYRSPEFNWMAKNAAKFGFDHAEGNAVNEPWHWTHLEKRVVGSTAVTQAVQRALPGSNATAVAATISRGLLKFAALAVNSKTTAINRARAMGASSRDTLMTSGGVHAARKASGTSSEYSDAEETALSYGLRPEGFQPADALRVGYDFKTGLWGDGKPV